MNTKNRRIAITTIRVILGLLFLVSSVGKFINSSDAQYLVELMATKFFWLIEYKQIIVLGTSVVELILAGLLLWGRYLKTALAGSLVMLLSFTSSLSYFYLNGMNVENCGCFGAFSVGGGTEFTLIRNSVLILLVIIGFVLVAGKTELQKETA